MLPDNLPVYVLGAVVAFVLFRRGYLDFLFKKPPAASQNVAAAPIPLNPDPVRRVNAYEMTPSPGRWVSDEELAQVDTYRLGKAFYARLRDEAESKVHQSHLFMTAEQYIADYTAKLRGQPQEPTSPPKPPGSA